MKKLINLIFIFVTNNFSIQKEPNRNIKFQSNKLLNLETVNRSKSFKLKDDRINSLLKNKYGIARPINTDEHKYLMQKLLQGKKMSEPIKQNGDLAQVSVEQDIYLFKLSGQTEVYLHDGAYQLYNPDSEILEFIDPYLKVEYNQRGKPDIKIYDIINKIYATISKNSRLIRNKDNNILYELQQDTDTYINPKGKSYLFTIESNMYKKLKLSEKETHYCQYSLDGYTVTKSEDQDENEPNHPVLYYKACTCDDDYLIKLDTCKVISSKSIHWIIKKQQSKNEIYDRPNYTQKPKKKLNFVLDQIKKNKTNQNTFKIDSSNLNQSEKSSSQNDNSNQSQSEKSSSYNGNSSSNNRFQ